jgi:hypothetical protein
MTALRPTVDGGLLVAGALEFEGFVSGGLVLLEPVPEPMITQQPQAPPSTQAGGSGVTLSVDALTNGDTTYQWQVQYGGNGTGGAQSFGVAAADDGFVDVPGANGATLSFRVPQTFHNGVYRVVITANGHTVVSDPVTVDVAAAAPSPNARLLNLSTRALVQTNDNVLIPGFVIAGTANKRLLIRAVGPTLGEAPYNVPGVLADPRIAVKKRNFATNTDEDIADNDNWATNANVDAIRQAMTDLYAFEIPDDSNDAALLLDLTPGQYTVVTDGVASGTGIAIVELYDADATGASARLVNISNRGFAGTGDHVMIPGFVVSSEGPKTLLIRAVGPTLAAPPYNVSGTMADPKLTVFQTNPVTGASTEILAQDNWGGNPEAAFTAQTAADVSAFPLAAGSADAAFVVTLPPGLYTVIGSAADGTSTGVVLVEVYVVE